jgi:AraC-like DNA-binding protein
MLRESDVSGDLGAGVRSVILAYLHMGETRIAFVEKALSMSRQTIYRKLRSEDMSFSSLLEEIRMDRAADYLMAGDMTIEVIAFLLGYAETSALNHAFRRWHAESPSGYRMERAEGSGRTLHA